MENTSNGVMGNGGVSQQESPAAGPSGPRFRSERTKKEPTQLPAVERYNWLMHKHYTRHEFDRCKALIERELKEWGSDLCEFPHYLMGLILRREGKVQDSLDRFEKAYKIHPRNVNNVKQIARSLFLLGDHKKAIDVYHEAIKMTEIPNWMIHYNLGECYAKIKSFEEAKAQLMRAKELTRNEGPYIELAKILVAEDRVNEAIVVYTEAFDAAPENIDIATELGQLYLSIGDTKRAFQQFGTALARTPDYPKAMLPVAYISQSHGEYDVAFAKYKVAASSMPESWAVWNNIGMCLYGKQKYISAITCLKRAHYLNPLALPPACNLGIVFLTTGQSASAAIYLCGAVTASPDNYLPYLLLGLALKKLDDLEGAEKALDKAYALGPQDPHVLVNYALILDARGSVERARELLNLLSDVVALVDVVDPQVTKTARLLTAKLNKIDAADNNVKEDDVNQRHQQRVLADNEV